MTRTSGSVRFATAVYRNALRFLPRDFRERYATELVTVFREIAFDARARGVFAVANVTFRSLADLASDGPWLHARAARAEVMRPGGVWMGTWQDFRHAARGLARRPSFTLVSVITLALGVAAATSVFTLVNGVILSPLPYPNADRIVQVDHGGRGIGISRELGIAYGFYRYYAAHLKSVEATAMYGYLQPTLTGAGEPTQLNGARVTPSLASVLGMPPRLGRWFTADEGRVGAAPVVLLSEQLWRDRFASDPGIVGRSVHLDGLPVEIVGVMPAAFAFPGPDTRVWLPFQVQPTGIGGWGEKAVALLKPSTSAEGLEREIASLFPGLRASDETGRAAEYLDDAGIFPRIVPFKDELIGNVRSTLWVLLGSVGFLLLVAVANVTNLFLVRAEEGQREMAVRTALGAAPGRLARGSLAEALLLAVMAGGLGVALAAVAVQQLRLHAPVNIPRQHQIGLSVEVVAVAIVTTLAVAVLLGLIPILGRRRDLGVALKEGARRSTAGKSTLSSRNLLVAAQVALALVLLIGSSLLLRTFTAMRAVPLGFGERHALVFELGLPAQRYPSWGDAKRFSDRLRERLAEVPGVRSVGQIAQCLPLVGYMCFGDVLEAEGKPVPQGTVPPVIGVRAAGVDYFRAMDIPVRGRVFTRADQTDSGSVAILSEAGARAYFPGQDPIGRRVRFSGARHGTQWYTIVGVARDVRVRIETDDFKRLIYLPIVPREANGPSSAKMMWVLATGMPPLSIAPVVRQVVEEADPGLPLARLGTLRDLINDATAPTAFALTLVALAAVIALLLGAVGVYAVIAYAVSRRTAEIGVRLALGARAADVRWMVVRQGGAVVIAGIVAGLAGALVLTRTLRAMLFGVSPTDVASYAVQTMVMLGVALLALYLPARRAAGVDPMEALRAD